MTPRLAEILGESRTAVHIGLSIAYAESVMAAAQDKPGAPMVHYVDLAKARTRPEMLAIVEEVLRFPTSGGYDSALDWLSDLDWFDSSTGHIVVFAHIENFFDTQPAEYRGFVEIIPYSLDRMRGAGTFGHFFLTGTDEKFLAATNAALQKSNGQLEKMSESESSDEKPVTIIDHHE